MTSDRPAGFIDIADAFARRKIVDTELYKIADQLEVAYRSGRVSERLGGFARLYSAFCYSIAGDYHFKRVLDDLRELGTNSHLMLDDILVPSLSKSVMQAFTDFCDEEFPSASRQASELLDFVGKLAANPDLRHSYLKLKNEDELNLLVDTLSVCKESSQWLMGVDVKRYKPSEFLGAFAKDIESLRNELEHSEVPPWLRWLGYLFYALAERQVESKSFHTFFHNHGLDCVNIRSVTGSGVAVCFQPQIAACDQILEGDDVILSSETGTGKTTLGVLAIASKRNAPGIAVYAAPSRALAYQVYNKITRMAYADQPNAVRVFTREEEVGKEQLSGCKVLVGTYEKVDGILRQKLVTKNDIPLLVVDECHSIASLNRGITLDFFLSKFRSTNPTQRLLLSAVIPEKDRGNFANWAKIERTLTYGRPWRRTKLDQKVYYADRKMDPEEFLQLYEKFGFQKKPVGKIQRDPVVEECVNLFREGKIVLVIVESRRTAEKLASNLSEVLTGRAYHSLINDAEIAERLEKSRKEALGHIRKIEELELVSPKLHSFATRLLANSVVFHHAGLPHDLREIVENAIENRMVGIVVATTTLEMGVNFPVDTVLVSRLLQADQVKPVRKVRERNRFLKYAYSRYIDTARAAYKNTIGRAGRAGYSERGESVYFIRVPDDAESFRDVQSMEESGLAAGGDLYFLSQTIFPNDEEKGIPHRVESVLDESRGRFLSNLLSIINSSDGEFASIISTVKETWLWHKLSELLSPSELKNAEGLVGQELGFLIDRKLAEQRGKYLLTRLGERISVSLIYPTSVMRMLFALARCTAQSVDEVDFYLMYVIGLAHEIHIGPAASIPKKSDALVGIKSMLEAKGAPDLLRDSRAYLIAGILFYWSRGLRTEAILEKFGLPQDNYGFVEQDIPQNALWLLGFLARCAREGAIPISDSITSRIDVMLQYLRFGTDDEIAQKLLGLGVAGIRRTSALAIVERFALKGLENIPKMGETQFVSEFRDKQQMARAVYGSLLQKVSSH